jgi:ribonuclease J
MNITTNKDFFSDENGIGRKPERRRGRRMTPLPIAENKISTTTSLGSSATRNVPRPRFEKPALPTRDPIASPSMSQLPPENPPAPEDAPARRTAFYQAAAPKKRDGAPAMPVPPAIPVIPNRPAPAQLPPRPLAPRPPLVPRAPLAGNRSLANNLGQGFSAPLPGTPPAPQRAPLPMGNTDKKLRIIPLGGLEEIGKNMTIFEYGDDIIIVDMGLLFPDSEMFGVDYLIPDVTYLVENKHKIRGTVITHGHMDHIGAIPYIVEKLGFPPMYGTPITLGIIKGRLEEFNQTNRQRLINIEADKDVLQLGAFRIRPFRLIHSIPGALGLEIETPTSRIVYATDWKFDYTPSSGEPIDFRNLAAIGSRGVDLLFSDSTNADRPGHSVSEKVVEAAIQGAVKEATGRLIVSMFASDLNRMQMALNAAAATGRKVLVQGRSMQNNMTMAIDLKAIIAPPDTIISERELARFPEEKILVLATGAQGQDNSALTRMAKGEHRLIKIKKGDTVILSASPIPGNERSISNMMEMIYKAGANVVYNKVLDVHTSGHAYQEDLKLMAALIRPRYFMPLHGERARRILHGKIAQEAGVAAENVIIADNGSVIEVGMGGTIAITDEVVPAGHVIVDGLGVGDIGAVVLRDRQAMAQEGIFVVITVYDVKKRQFITSPDIISRGFIYMRENEKFVNDIRNEIKRFLAAANSGAGKIDLNTVRNDLRDMLSKMLYMKTEREPIVIPVIIEL